MTIEILVLNIGITLIATLLFQYFLQKGQNLATKEDIGAITKEVELVKKTFKEHYDLSKNEKELYTKMVQVVQKFLSQIKKHDQEIGRDTTKTDIDATPHLKDGFHEFINNANEILALAFVFLDEDSYRRLRDSLKVYTNFQELRFDLMDAMRGSIYRDTAQKAKDDSWDIKY